MIASIQNVVSGWVFNKTGTHLDITGHHTVHTEIQNNVAVSFHNFPVSQTDILCRSVANYLIFIPNVRVLLVLQRSEINSYLQSVTKV